MKIAAINAIDSSSTESSMFLLRDDTYCELVHDTKSNREPRYQISDIWTIRISYFNRYYSFITLVDGKSAKNCHAKNLKIVIF